MIPAIDFVLIWNNSATRAEAVAALGPAAKCRAVRLRKRGFPVKRFPPHVHFLPHEVLRANGLKRAWTPEEAKRANARRKNPYKFTLADRRKAREMQGTLQAVERLTRRESRAGA